MGLPVTVFTSDDAGAPQMGIGTHPKPSEIIAILKACLVDGYGAKSAIGWTMPFSDNVALKYVFRNSAVNGSGGAVQMWDDDGGTDLAAAKLMMHAGTSIVGLDSIINAGYLQSFNILSYTNGVDWALIGNDRAFYFMINQKGAQISGRNIASNATFFVGDFDSFYPGDNHTFIVQCNPNINGDWTGGSQSYTNSFTNIFVSGGSQANIGSMKLTGTDATVNMVDYGFYIATPSMINTTSSYQFTGDEQGVYDTVLISAKGVSPSSYNLLSPDDKPYIISTVYPRVRGKLPGLIIDVSPTHNGGSVWPLTAIKSSKSHMVMPVCQQPNALWINAEDW